MATTTFQQEGVEFLVAGMSKFLQDLGAAQGAYDKTINSIVSGEKSLTKGTGALGKLGSGFLKGAGQALGLNTAFGALAGGLTTIGIAAGSLAVTVGKKLVGAFNKLASQTAVVQGLAAGFAGFTAEMEGGADGMLRALQAGSAGMIKNRDLMQSFNQAASLVSRDFAQRLPEAFESLTKVAVTSGKSLDFLLDSLVTGVGRLSPKILDNLMVQTNLAEITAHGAEMFGKSADALSILEKQAAATDLVLERLAANTAAIPDVSQTAIAQGARFQATLANIADTLGMFLLPAWTSFMSGLNSGLSAFQAAISEGGALYDELIAIGAALGLVGDAFKAGVDFVIEWIDGLNLNISGGLADIATDAIQWGADIVTGLAEGMIDAASTVLTVAMDALSKMFSWWLEPTSPPRVAPGLNRWGMEAMAEYLRGFTEADFDILEGIQKPLEQILSGPQFADLSQKLIEALGTGDRGEFLDLLAQNAGKFGDELVRLADLEFSLADAVTGVEEAERQLEEARQGIQDAQADIGRLTNEYNDLIRAGADPAILDQKLAEINAAEDALVTEQEAAKQAEKDKDLADEALDGLKERLALQEKVVQQLLDLNKALEEEAEKEKKIAAGKRGKGKPAGEVDIPGFGKIDIAGKIGAAIEAAKEQVKEKLKGMFAPLFQAWDKVELGIEGLGLKWEMFKDKVGETWDALKEKFPFLQSVEDWVTNLVGPEGLDLLSGKWSGKFMDAITAVGDYFKDPLIPFFESIGKLVLALAGKAGETGLALLTKGWELNLGAMQKLFDWAEEHFVPWLEEKFPGLLDELSKGPLTLLIEHFGTVTDRIKDLTTWIGNLADKIAEFDITKLLPFMGSSPSPLGMGLAEINRELEKMSVINLPASLGIAPQAQTTFTPTGGGFTPGRGIGGGIDQSTSLQVGPNSFAGPMTPAMVESIVLRTMRRGTATA